MAKEATSFEAKVVNLGLGEKDEPWAQISWYAPVETAQAESGSGNASTVMTPTEHCSIYIRTSQLPGIRLGDKVQVALCLK